MRSLEIILPMPPSINNAYSLTKAKRVPDGKGGWGWERSKVRSPEYNAWTQKARIQWNYHAERHGNEFLCGRLGIKAFFIWNENSKSICDIANGESSDIDNRIKCLADFLQSKFFENDKQIDVHHHERRIFPDGDDRVHLRVYEIRDRRYDPITF